MKVLLYCSSGGDSAIVVDKGDMRWSYQWVQCTTDTERKRAVRERAHERESTRERERDREPDIESMRVRERQTEG